MNSTLFHAATFIRVSGVAAMMIPASLCVAQVSVLLGERIRMDVSQGIHVNVSGNWSCDNLTTSITGGILFDGHADQEIHGGTLEVGTMIIDKASGVLTVRTHVVVQKKLAYQRGSVETENATLTIEKGAVWENRERRQIAIESTPITRLGEGAPPDQSNGSSKRMSGSPDNSLPAVVQILQNYPNPFNHKTVIQYDLPTQEQVTLELFDGVGRSVQLLVDQSVPAGRWSIEIDAGVLASGTYFIQLRAGKTLQTRSLVLLK